VWLDRNTAGNRHETRFNTTYQDTCETHKANIKPDAIRLLHISHGENALKNKWRWACWTQHATINISVWQCNNGLSLPLFVASNFFDQIALCILKNEAQAPSHNSTKEHGLLIPSLLHQLPKDWNAAKNQEMANMTICCSAYKYQQWQQHYFRQSKNKH
jgi:hypothetical protein